MSNLVNRGTLKILLLALVGLLLFAGCGRSASTTDTNQKVKIVIASKPFSEQYILGHMAAMLIRGKAGLDTDMSKIGMGPTEMLHPAMKKGQIDIYPEYTGTAWMAVLKMPVEQNKDVIYQQTKKLYEEKYRMHWMPTLGFQNTFAVATTQETAKKFNAKTIGDISNIDGLVLIGDATAFSRVDEYPGLKKTYGLRGEEKVVDVNFYYEALKQKEGDIALVFSTDGRLKQYNLVVLEDTKKFFPPYETAYIVRKAIIDKYPKVQEALNLLSGKINERTMIDLNYKVEVEKQDPEKVAEAFLRSKGLL